MPPCQPRSGRVHAPIDGGDAGARPQAAVAGALVKVALFFDGKNFYSGWKRAAPGVEIAFGDLAQWLVRAVGGDQMWGAHYYTGVEEGGAERDAAQRGLERFLDMLEHQRGFFVRRLPRRQTERRCEHCGEETRYSQEKEVDTTIVADMLRYAAVGAFDVAVLVSGDADLAPAVEGVRALGKQVVVATWASYGLSSRLRRAAYDHVDLMVGIAAFCRQRPGDELVAGRTEVAQAATGALDATLADDTARISGPNDTGDADDAPATEDAATAKAPTSDLVDASAPEPEVAAPAQSGEQLVLDALAAAERHFATGYVGRFFFVSRWRYHGLDENPGVRNRLLEALIDSGKVEVYRGGDSAIAIRIRRS